MATIWQGVFYSQLFTMKDCTTNTPINIIGWQFHAQFRLDPEDPVLLDLTSTAGEFVIHDAAAGSFSMQIQAADTALLPAGEILRFDVLRVVPNPAPVMLFWGKVPVKQPLTQLPPPPVPPPPDPFIQAASMRQWQSALQAQGKLQAVVDSLPADRTDPVYVQWMAGAQVLSGSLYVDAVWSFTKTVTGYNDAQMATLYNLALGMAV